MASAKILQRAETAMEIAGDFLYADDDDDEEDDADDGSENCDENADADDGEEAKSSKRGEPDDEQKEGEGGEKTSDSEANQAGQTKKSQKSMGKKLKSLMGVAMRPFGSKLQWKVDFNFEASNKRSNRNDGRKNGKSNSETGEKKTSRTSNADDKKPVSADVAEIRRLRMENKRLEKLADKFLDAYIQLKTRIGELSEVEGQLIATRSNYDKLKEELQDLQRSRESLITNLTKQSEEHRAEVNRLDAELKKAAKDLAKLEQDKKSFEDKDKKNVEDLQLVRKELETLTSNQNGLKLELSKQEETHRSETRQLNQKLENAEKEKSELAVQHLKEISMLQRDIGILEERATMAEAENVRLQREARELENEKASLRSNLNTSTANVNELRRAIAVLESSPSTSTSVDSANRSPFSCPLCGQQFGSLANMQLHAEDCCT